MARVRPVGERAQDLREHAGGAHLTVAGPWSNLAPRSGPGAGAGACIGVHIRGERMVRVRPVGERAQDLREHAGGAYLTVAGP